MLISFATVSFCAISTMALDNLKKQQRNIPNIYCQNVHLKNSHTSNLSNIHTTEKQLYEAHNIKKYKKRNTLYYHFNSSKLNHPCRKEK